MEILIALFSHILVFYYHCFDRIVVNGYLSMLERPANISFFFHDVCGISCITKDVLSTRTKAYQTWVEGFARNQQVPFEWAEKGVRKEDYVRPWLEKMEKQGHFGVYFIIKSMEQGKTFRCSKPKYPTDDPNYRILTISRSRFTHYYFYLRDEKLGPMVLRVASFFPFQVTCYLNGHHFIERELLREGIKFKKNDNAIVSCEDPEMLQHIADRLGHKLIAERIDYWTYLLGPKFSEKEREAMNLHRFYSISQVEYCLNFIFRRNSPIRRLFQRSCELSMIRLNADRISNVFGWRKTSKLKGKLMTTLQRMDQGHHVFRAYFKKSFVKQYEKLRTFLRMELCSNNIGDLRLKKGLENLEGVREKGVEVLDRFAQAQANVFNVHIDFPLLETLGKTVKQGKTTIAGIKLHESRMIRLMEVLLHLGASIDGWTSRKIYEEIVNRYEAKDYTINQLRYDLRKLKSHGLIERHGKSYSYLLTKKGAKAATLFTLFHKRIFGPLANAGFNEGKKRTFFLEPRLENVYKKAEESISQIIDSIAS